MSNNKMKGLLKGLRYISQIFDADEKEPEMEIGYPTDVKHVAHIGWDGPTSINSPSWMNEFKGPPGMAPTSANGETKDDPASEGTEQISRRSTGWEAPNSPGGTTSSPRKASTSTARGLPELPKSSGRHSMGASGSEQSPTKAKSDKPKQTRRSTKSASRDNNMQDGASKSTRHQKDSSQGSEPSSNLPEIPKKSRRKKSGGGGGGGSTSKSSRVRAAGQAVEGGEVSESASRRGRSSHAPTLSADENELGGIS